MNRYLRYRNKGVVFTSRENSTKKSINSLIKLQPEIQIGSYNGRADLALTDAKGKLIVIAECKRSGYIGSGVEQLHFYLSASVDTQGCVKFLSL